MPAETSSITDVVMPQLGVSVAEGTVVKWLVAPGEEVAADDPLCEVDTDKVVTDIPSPVAGVVSEIRVAVGTTVPVGTVLARIAPPGTPVAASAPSGAADRGAAAAAPAGADGDAPARARPADDAASASAPPAQAVPGGVSREELAAHPAETAMSGASLPSAPASAALAGPSGGAARNPAAVITPVVSRLAAELGVDLSRVRGSGRGGRIRKQDVLAAAATGATATHAPAAQTVPASAAVPPAPAPAPQSGTASPAPSTGSPLHIDSPYRPDADDQPGRLSRMRRAIGEHMKRSLETAATCTTWMEADMSRVEAARRDAKASALLGVTPLPIVARATIDALAEHPALNATLEGERYTRHRAVHLGIAVSLGEDGLIVPVIRNAQELSVEELGVAIRDLSRRARRGQLKPDEVRGGTFTITNPGHFGSLMATPIINQPQVAILDLEAIVKRPIVVQDESGNDMIEIRPHTILGLSWDHRALDGAQAAQFLGALRRRLERWDG